jgi:hypothetical protein
LAIEFITPISLRFNGAYGTVDRYNIYIYIIYSILKANFTKVYGRYTVLSIPLRRFRDQQTNNRWGITLPKR